VVGSCSRRLRVLMIVSRNRIFIALQKRSLFSPGIIPHVKARRWNQLNRQSNNPQNNPQNPQIKLITIEFCASIIMMHRIFLIFGLACSSLVIFTNATTSKEMIAPSPAANKSGKNGTAYPVQYQVLQIRGYICGLCACRIGL